MQRIIAKEKSFEHRNGTMDCVRCLSDICFLQNAEIQKYSEHSFFQLLKITASQKEQDLIKSLRGHQTTLFIHRNDSSFMGN